MKLVGIRNVKSKCVGYTSEGGMILINETFYNYSISDRFQWVFKNFYGILNRTNSLMLKFLDV